MKSGKTSGTLGLMAVALLASPLASAQAPHWYGGVNLGVSRATIDDERITGNLLSRGFTGVSIQDDERDAGYKLYGGYQFNKNFALEAGYFDLGKFGFTATTVPAGTLNGNIKLRGFNFDAVGILPITEKLSALGRVGVNYAEARDQFSGTGAVTVTNPNPSKRDTNHKYGFGIQYAFTDALAMRVEAERYRINDAVGNKGDVDLFSVGLLYRFGGKTPAPAPYVAAPQPAPAPAVVAAAPPPPPPKPAPVVAPPAPRKVTFSADSLFAFDQSTIKPEGKQHLDKLSADLRGTSYDVISVTGHTDRLGTSAYNQGLSTRRAEMVKSYLTDSAGIPAGKISARGAGETQPVTKPGECPGQKVSKKLIECLQPDRRVEVEVTGTK
jgi:OOP family OmpA-OmpF porin